MTQRRQRDPECNRRVVDAPEASGRQGLGWDTEAEDGANPDSPAPPLVSSPLVQPARSTQRSHSQGWQAVGRVILMGLLLGGVSAAAVLGTYRFAQTSPRFAVRQIDIDGLRRKNREAILDLSHVTLGKNIFSVDTKAVEGAILVDSWIREVKVERRLPATIRIELVERDAGALAMLGEQMLVVTRTGDPFKKYESSDPADLPIITGVSVDEPGREPSLERRRIGLALEVFRHYERTSLARLYPAQELHLTPGGEVVLTVGKTGIALHLGAGPWAKKLAMAERVLGKLRGQKGSVGMVFLDNRAHPERVVVRMK
jgi:cell division protein FtsQ